MTSSARHDSRSAAGVPGAFADPAPSALPADPAHAFVQFALDAGVLSFGSYTTKAGRLSPYFFNAGGFADGVRLGRLAEFYATRLLAPADASGARLSFDALFGPAYKGIALAATLAVELARRGSPVGFAYNRKEAKDHGEGGALVGAPLAGRRVLIVDDVISAGTSVRESIASIRAAGGTPAGVVIALDRQERSGAADDGSAPAVGAAAMSAVQYVEREAGLPVAAVARLDDLLDFLRRSDDPALVAHLDRVAAYRAQYGT